MPFGSRAAATTATWTRPPSADATGDALRLAVEWWLADRPAKVGLAEGAGIRLAAHPSGKPVVYYKLLALAALVEVGPLQTALDLFRRIDADGAFEAHLVDGAPLDLVLDAAARAGARPEHEERLAWLSRFRRGLLALPRGSLAACSDARALAARLREVAGPALGPGLVLVVRELVASQLHRVPGLDGIDWLPWPEPGA